VSNRWQQVLRKTAAGLVICSISSSLLWVMLLTTLIDLEGEFRLFSYLRFWPVPIPFALILLELVAYPNNNNPYYRFHVSKYWCKGWLSSPNWQLERMLYYLKPLLIVVSATYFAYFMTSGKPDGFGGFGFFLFVLPIFWLCRYYEPDMYTKWNLHKVKQA
jgi:hypothetical protein